MNKKIENKIKQKRSKRVRKQIMRGDSPRPRLSVFRSNKYIYAQIIDDSKNKTLISASSKEIKSKKKIEAAYETGKIIAEKAKKSGISVVVFDRGKYKFHGRVKALAEGARGGKLSF